MTDDASAARPGERGPSRSEPVFLVGSTRSGTTLLEPMLDHHPDLCVPREFEIAVDLVRNEGALPPLEVYRNVPRGDSRSGLPALRLGALDRVRLSLEERLGRMRGRHRTYGWRLWCEDAVARRVGSAAWRRRVQLRVHDVINRGLQ